MELHVPIDKEISDVVSTSGETTIKSELYHFPDNYSFSCIGGVMLQTVTIDGERLDDPRKQKREVSVLGHFIDDLYNDMINTGWDPGDALQEISGMYPQSK